MQLNAVIAGVGMTTFGKHLETGLKALGVEAVQAALADAGIAPTDVEAAWVGNAAAGLVTGQECIRGQVVLRAMGLGKLPVVNVENACASASTALNQAAAMVTAGLYDVVLALGVEKLYHADKKKSFAAFSGAVDVEAMQAIMAGLRKNAAEALGKIGDESAIEALIAALRDENVGVRKESEIAGLSRDLAAVAGVVEVSVIAGEGVAYLKVEKHVLDDKKLLSFMADNN